jgi:pimeloyl-ACP methyl ester carboxylesterase
MANGQYVTVNGHPLYYEEYGQGQPLVLLHGGAHNLHNSFDCQIPVFAQTYRVIGIEQVGHGHTPDIPGPITYDAMAEDTAVMLRQLNITGADVIGWSDGGILGLMLASRHPDLVHHLVVSGANIRWEDMESELTRYLRETPADQLFPTWREAYEQVSQDGPDHWPLVIGKIRDMWLTPVYMEVTELTKICAPTLVVSGDHGDISAEETLEIFRAIPQAQLCILPGTDHFTFQHAAGWLNPIMLAFLSTA